MTAEMTAGMIVLGRHVVARPLPVTHDVVLIPWGIGVAQAHRRGGMVAFLVYPMSSLEQTGTFLNTKSRSGGKIKEASPLVRERKGLRKSTLMFEVRGRGSVGMISTRFVLELDDAIPVATAHVLIWLR
jgi:hypothetical protein